MSLNINLSADDILAIPLDMPERLFSSADAAEKEARQLFKRWHPDHCSDPRAGDVFDWLRKLDAAADSKIAQGVWETPGLLRITSTSGSQFELRYASKTALEVGTMYVGRSVVAFDIPTDNLDLLANAERQLAALTYANEAMRREFARYFPAIERKVDTPTGAVLLLKKDPGVLLLQDVLDHYKGKLPARHVAWVISRLLNIACYLEMQGKVSHNAIGPDTVFISPAEHTAHLFGGWWFAAGLGTPLKAASQRMMLFAPPDVLQKKVGDSRTDMEMIQALGRELLGDATGVRLAKDSAVPAAMVDWLQLSTHQSAVATYRDWQERVLVEAFGPRKFVPMELTHEMLY
ncbi:hypothetical protein [Burkholderia ubonensis]|uniref:hypothetical protein n=1 Tax=Burkholderia ubonensis TaxID=101571 RepID=UPI00075EDC6B|nr:hypothetical protein [Burkholderia ubonensis]KVP17161.1 hypothetical protein WJ84_02455 [Burkholderia ubonensis]